MFRIMSAILVPGLLAACGGGGGAGTKVTLEIGGMTCGNCEAHVREALESLPGVEVLAVSAAEGTAVIATTQAHTEADYRSVLTSEGKTLRKITYRSATP